MPFRPFACLSFSLGRLTLLLFLYVGYGLCSALDSFFVVAEHTGLHGSGASPLPCNPVCYVWFVPSTRLLWIYQHRHFHVTQCVTFGLFLPLVCCGFTNIILGSTTRPRGRVLVSSAVLRKSRRCEAWAMSVIMFLMRVMFDWTLFLYVSRMLYSPLNSNM